MSETLDPHRAEVLRGDRFEFGRNWARFLTTLSDQRIALAEKSLRDMLGVTRLDGKTFLDVGSGSGLFSLAARRLGARVHSFDYDPDSVGCTATLRERYFPGTEEWVVARGSVLDTEYLARLGTFDIVYSWGVLHHTGAMWQAFENVKPLVRESGKLFIAIYNDQGAVTDRWSEVKRTYNALPRLLAFPYALNIIARSEWPAFRDAVVHGKLGTWIDLWRNYADRSTRGMNRWFDWIDWIGGHPYERATIEQVVDTFARDGFRLFNLFDCSSGYGCNEFVFTRDAPMGTWVESRIPGGSSFVRRYCTRLPGPFEQRPSGYYGAAASTLSTPDPSSWVLLRNGKLVGPADCEPGGKFKIAPLADPPRDDEVFHVGPARILDATEPFTPSRGKMWNWSAPQLEAIADNAEPPNQSPVFIFQDSVQLPYPHALHDDIARDGGGRFSHWGRYVYFSTLGGQDPNADPRCFKMVVATANLSGDVLAALS